MALGACFLLLAVLAWPRILEHVVTLKWRAGNLRPLAYGLQALLFLMGAACLVARARVNQRIEAVLQAPRRRVFGLVAVLLAIAAGLVVVEIGLRILGLPFNRTHTLSEMALAQFDPELGWSYIPNRTVVQRFGTEQREVAMHFSELGSRARGPGVHYDAAAPTVLFVGCSVTMGHGVPYEESLEGQLEALPGFPLQVVNLGVQAYGTDQSLLMLKRKMKKFNTKVVVYTYLDLHIERNENDDRRLIIPTGRFLGTKPLFDLGRDGALYLSKKPVRYEEMAGLRVMEALELFYTRWGPVPRKQLTRALIQEMKQYVEENGATFLVVHWRLAPRRPGTRDAVLDGLNLRVLDTGESMPPSWPTWRIPGDGHPDVRAHGHVAKRLAAELEKLGWPAKGRAAATQTSS